MCFYRTNGGESNIFGLEPNYGCCTANLSQPWPKLAMSIFMQSQDGLAVPIYAPCTVKTSVNNAKVSITLDTGYPFRESLDFKVTVDRETGFALWLRVPGWAEGACLKIGGRSISLKNGDYYRLEQVWSGETSFTLHFPMHPRIVSRPNNLYAVTRGPLVYSLPIAERWVRINRDIPGREPPHCDYEIYPATPWNYGLCLDKNNPESGIRFEELPIGDCPFSPGGAPVVAHVRGKKVDWDKKNGCAAPYPGMDRVSNEEEELRLIPYGCTNLRMTEMPLL
ncbi:MAG: glycoside hydrolase family 127 protein [Firmicutes bacterium]|nr:glycoside hydrolase family 127 protein [Bacillota bacterium]